MNLTTKQNFCLSFPGGSNSKESACDAGDLGLIPGLGRSPGEGHGSPLHVQGEFPLCPPLAGYHPWGCKEWDTAE